MKHRIHSRAAQFRLDQYALQTLAAEETEAEETEAEEAEPVLVTWSGPIGIEGRLTGDGRIIETNALRWDTLPMNLRWGATGNHHDAEVVGHINTLERRSDGMIWATGDFDMGSEVGREAARQVDQELTPGVSMDLDDVSFEVRVAAELLGMGSEDEVEIPQPDEEGRVTVMKIASDDEVLATTDARIRSATMVAIPAFEELRLTLDNPLTQEDLALAASAVVEEAESLLAGAAPVAPPRAWFDDPQFPEPTRLTIDDNGRFRGHLAAWGTCHTAFPGQCVTAPSSPSGYAHFHVGTLITAEGDEIAVGPITMDTLHAARTKSAVDTLAHYEHTGRAIADVRVGEDAHGIWVAGALRPTVTAEQVRALRASPLSGDWRRLGGALELVAALAVNTPGFPIPRPQGLVASGVTTSLVASGMLPPSKVIAPGNPGALSMDDLRYLKRLARRERDAQAAINDEAAVLARRVQADAMAAKVRQFAPTLTPTT